MAAKRFSREGFQPLPGDGSTTTMTNPNDATIDIPLTAVQSNKTGARKPTGGLSPSTFRSSTENEKAHFGRGPGGRRKRMEQKGKQNHDNEDGALNSMGKIYKAIYNFSIVTRYFLYVLPLALGIAAPIVVGATTAKKATIGGVRIVWFFTWVEIVWLSLWVSKLVSQFLPLLFQFLCGIISSGTRKYALVIASLEIPLSLVGWSLTALTTFVPMMTLNPDQRKQKNGTTLTNWESICKDILFAAFFSTLILLAEKVLIQLISISYHRKQFDQKIKQSKHNVYLISLLYDASRNLFPAYCPEFAAEDYVINDSLDLNELGGTPLKSGSRSHNRSGSATPMRLIQNVGRMGDKVTAAFGNVAHEITGKQVFNPTSAHSIVVEALERTTNSEALARRLWMSFVMEGKEALYQEDIVDVLGADRAEEAEECFHCLDRDGNGDISLDEMILTVCEFGKERFSIANSMHDVDQAINVLDNLLITVVFIVVVFVFVAFLNKSFTTTLATAGTALLSLSFVFSVTAQEVLGSCIFIFVKHPYDVGDRVDINDNQLVVERISLLFTVFRKVKDHKTTQVPNILLNTTWIDNVTRSKAMREQIFLYINADTTLDDIALLKNEMSAFVSDKENSRDFQPDFDVELTGLANMDKLELKVEVRHKSNWHNEAVRAARRSKFMCALVLALRKVPIHGPGAGSAAAGDPANPTYSVAITNEIAEQNKKHFSDEKDKARMVPAAVAQSKPVTALSPTIGKSSGVDFGTLGLNVVRSPSKSIQQAQDTSIVASINPNTAALSAVHEQQREEVAHMDTQRSNDIRQVRDILRQGSVTGRRRAPSASQTNFTGFSPPDPSMTSTTLPPPTTQYVPPPQPISKQASKVDYYEETPEYRPPTSDGNRPYGSNNSYVAPLRTNTRGAAQQAPSPAQQQFRERSSSMTNRRPTAGSGSPSGRFPVNPSLPGNSPGGFHGGNSASR